VFVKVIAQRKPAIAGRGNGGAHPVNPAVPVKRMYHAMRPALTCQRAAFWKRGTMGVWVHLITVKWHRCVGSTEAVYKEHADGKQSEDTKFCSYTNCVHNSRIQRNRDIYIAMDIV